MKRMSGKHCSAGRVLFALMVTAQFAACTEDRAEIVEFCLDGEFDLGARYQGMHPAAGERYATRFCYTADDRTGRVQFSGSGRSNPDLHGEFVVSYLVPQTVRIVNRQSPPDIEFSGKRIVDEALRHRRVDPRYLVAEIEAHPGWITGTSNDGWLTVQYPGSPFESRIRIEAGKLREVQTTADLPLRGRVPVRWEWRWPADGTPMARLLVDDDVVFSAQATWRMLGSEEADELWELSGGQEAIALAGDRWPAEIDLRIQEIADGVHLVNGVRTGFAQLVVESSHGLIIGDAPAGWVELQQLPPSDLVPGLGVSGLSENVVDFLGTEFPGTPIHAVAITHVHDDHAGGARAFAAAGADIYAPAGIAAFLNTALNRPAMPDDRLAAENGRVTVIPVDDRVTLDDPLNSVELIVLPPGPHVDQALGIWARDAGVFFQSDLHVPNSDADIPREDRAVTECWFSEWAIAKLPPDTIVLNSHTRPRTPVSRLASYEESETCRAL